MTEPYSEWLSQAPDRELDYYRAIEEHLAQKGGFPWIIRGKDWMIARSWYEQGIPLNLIFRTIDEFYTRCPSDAPLFLGFLDPAIRRAWKSQRLAFIGSHIKSTETLPQLEEIRTWFNNWIALMEESARDADIQGFHTVAETLRRHTASLKRIAKTLDKFSQPNAQLFLTLETKLENLNDRINREVRKAVPEEILKEWQEQIRQDILQRLAGPLRSHNVAQSVRKNLTKLIRSRFHLPDFSLINRFVHMSPQDES